jgi:hypothetical protein
MATVDVPGSVRSKDPDRPLEEPTMEQPGAAERRKRGSAILAVAGVVAALVVVGACDVSTTLGAGPIQNDQRTLGPFASIEVSYGIGVTVELGPVASVEVQAQENLLPIVVTDVEGGTLRVYGTTEFAGDPVPQVVIVMPVLDAISLKGGSHGQVNGLANSMIAIDLGGGAGLTATGRAEHVVIDGSGGSLASLKDLYAGDVTLSLSGGAVAYVNASDEVLGDVSGGARAFVTGDARLNVTSSGGGEVQHD